MRRQSRVRKCAGTAGLGALLLSLGTVLLPAQSWKPLLNSGQAIDWSQSGVGGIPERTKLCATLPAGTSLAQINAALASCPSGETVYLSEGRYSLAGTIHVPSNVTLRGAGADRTVLDAVGKGVQYAVSLGSGSVAYIPVRITGGATAGSTSIQVANVARIGVGKYLAIAETNNPLYVNAAGSEGVCRWCDGDWSHTGAFSRGQIVEVTAVDGNTVHIAPGLYGAYTESPFAVSFTMSASYAGVEDLQVQANNNGYAANFGLSACAYCWLKGVEANFTDGDYVEVSGAIATRFATVIFPMLLSISPVCTMPICTWDTRPAPASSRTTFSSAPTAPLKWIGERPATWSPITSPPESMTRWPESSFWRNLLSRRASPVQFAGGQCADPDSTGCHLGIFQPHYCLSQLDRGHQSVLHAGG